MSGKPLRDGRADFDFLLGSWRVHNHRLKARLRGSTEWEDFPSTCRARPILSGLGNMDEFTIEAPAGRIEAVTVRLYDTRNGEWSIYWTTSPGTGRFDVPMVGRFEGGRGEFYSQELFEGRHIFNRFIWTAGSRDACRWEQAFSADGGRTWETNWIMEAAWNAMDGAAFADPFAVDADFVTIRGEPFRGRASILHRRSRPPGGSGTDHLAPGLWSERTTVEGTGRRAVIS